MICANREPGQSVQMEAEDPVMITDIKYGAKNGDCDIVTLSHRTPG